MFFPIINFFVDGDKLEDYDIAEVLVQIMSDEFNVLLEDGSEVPISKAMLRLYKDLNDRGDETFFKQLIEKKSHMTPINAVPQNTTDSEDDNENDDFYDALGEENTEMHMS